MDLQSLIKPRRRIVGMSAVLLPFNEMGAIDWPGFAAHLARTAAAGLTPAVNMDTGFGHLLDEATRRQVMAETRSVLGGGPFVAGAFVADRPGDPFNLDGYRQALDMVQEHGATPVVFQSHGLVALAGPDLLEAYRALGRDCPRYLAF